MILKYERSGGIANLTVRAEINTKDIQAQEARDLEQLVKNAHFFDEPEESQSEHTLADDFEHRLTIIDGSRTHTIHRTDHESSPQLLRLFDWLNERAAFGGGKGK